MVPGYKVALSIANERAMTRFLSSKEAIIVAVAIVVAVVAVILWRSGS
jgi:hypothetical protein